MYTICSIYYDFLLGACMHQNPIGFFDSGVGGLSVLKHAIKVMPEENYIYFGDSLNAPYGTKSNEQVFNLTRAGINKLIGQNVKAIVVACNTATSIAVDELRKTTKIPIISMEPAIKPALEKTDGNVLLLATNVTLSSRRVNNLIEKYDLNNRVIKLPCPELAKKIEEAVFEKNNIDDYIFQLLNPYKNQNVTSVVLGCTHYPFVRNKIRNIIGEKVKIFDGIEGTILHLKDILIENNIKNSSTTTGTVKLESSKKEKETIELYNKLLNGGIL